MAWLMAQYLPMGAGEFSRILSCRLVFRRCTVVSGGYDSLKMSEMYKNKKHQNHPNIFNSSFWTSILLKHLQLSGFLYRQVTVLQSDAEITRSTRSMASESPEVWRSSKGLSNALHKRCCMTHFKPVTGGVQPVSSTYIGCLGMSNSRPLLRMYSMMYLILTGWFEINFYIYIYRFQSRCLPHWQHHAFDNMHNWYQKNVYVYVCVFFHGS